MADDSGRLRSAVLPAATTEKDIEHLLILYDKSQGKAWEPPVPNHPWLVRMIAAGFLRRCTMRCGFEAFDSGVTWTDAWHLAMRDTPNVSGLSHTGVDRG